MWGSGPRNEDVRAVGDSAGQTPLLPPGDGEGRADALLSNPVHPNSHLLLGFDVLGTLFTISNTISNNDTACSIL